MENRLRTRKGDSGNSGMETLSLVAEPEAELTEPFVPPQSVGLKVRKGNRVWGLVEGQPCSIQLDSGTSQSFMFHSLAKKLGLDLDQMAQKTEIDTYHLWIGSRKVKFMTVENMHITLEGGVDVWTPVRVLPEALERHYDIDDLVLDVHLLHRGRMVQTFGQDESRLYICQPSQLLSKKGEDSAQSLGNREEERRESQGPKFWVQRADMDEVNQESLLSVFLDTGATNFYVSKNFLRTMMQRTESATKTYFDLGAEQGEIMMPHRVSLDLGGGHCLETEHVELVPQDVVDLVMGVELLHKYNAVVDYGDQTIVFTVNGKHFKVEFQLE